jgi:pimeloyl-ACP methyl ester carboxylesterase
MGTINVNGTDYAYIDEGDGPLVLFGHGLLASKEMFRAQIDTLRSRYRCTSIDWPGHGESGFRADGWDFYDLGEDAVEIVRKLGAERAVFAGLSQGGMVFMRMALRHPELVQALVLLDTSAGPEDPENVGNYRQMAELLRTGDQAARERTVDVSQTILYGQTWREEHPEGVQHERALMLAHDPEGIYLACQAVFDRDDVLDQVGAISAPTLIIVGEEDTATPPERAHELNEAIAGSELVVIPRAGHHSPIENPGPVTDAIERFLARVAPA